MKEISRYLRIGTAAVALGAVGVGLVGCGSESSAKPTSQLPKSPVLDLGEGENHIYLHRVGKNNIEITTNKWGTDLIDKGIAYIDEKNCEITSIGPSLSDHGLVSLAYVTVKDDNCLPELQPNK